MVSNIPVKFLPVILTHVYMVAAVQMSTRGGYRISERGRGVWVTVKY